VWIGAVLAGAAGVIMAIPAAGCLSVSMRHWREYREIEQLIEAATTTSAATVVAADAQEAGDPALR
jgi:predicted PurR-regulated permease PerM